MPDERDIAHDKKVLDEHKGENLEMVGEHPEHAPQPGRKTPQKDLIDEDAIDESGNLIHDDAENEDEEETFKI
ncbi:MAG: hypothetical protein ABI686_07760 [Acidobacteriota bacterium]